VSESRRGFLARAGEGLIALVGAGAVARMAAEPQDADAVWYTFCGHTYTTASCPHPTGMPRIDRRGYPLRASDGAPVDDLGRRVDKSGRPVDEHGALLRDPDGRPLAPAPRSRLCVDVVANRFHMRTYNDGSWYRCCGGHVRKLMDCCAFTERRINGDQALTGYCFNGRKVFCVQYYDTYVTC
jgi:hypothetical protein